jgi:hypothetical protein
MRREAGNYPASVNEDNWPRLFKRLCDECGFTADQVDQLIFVVNLISDRHEEFGLSVRDNPSVPGAFLCFQGCD